MNVAHWQQIYENKRDDEVSWTQTYPATAINYLESLGLPKDAHIIDVGGGTGNFAAILLELGYINITVLDISEAALKISKNRLGERAKGIHWIVADINEFESEATYDFWYDRAVFHFLTDDKWINNYVRTLSSLVAKGGHFLLGTFSENGPKKCSGLEIRQYSESKMTATFAPYFEVQKCFKETHLTPFNTLQEFQFCGFTKVETDTSQK